MFLLSQILRRKKGRRLGEGEEGKIIQYFANAVHMSFCRGRITLCLAVILWLFSLI